MAHDKCPASAKILHGLPAAPRSWYFLADGSFLMHTSQGMLTLDHSGRLTPVRCRP
jgi:hypothetical protein